MSAYDADKKVLRNMFLIKAEYMGEKVSIDTEKMLSYSADIDDEREYVVKEYQRVGSMIEEMKKKVSFAKIELDNLYGNLEEHARNVGVMTKVTDEKVKNYIKRDLNYVNARKQIAKMESVVGKLVTLQNSLRYKKQMLKEKGEDRRKDIEYGVGISKMPTKSKKRNKE